MAGMERTRTLVPPSFGISFFSHPHGLIRVVDQFVLYLFQKTLHSAFLNDFKRHSVNARSSVITFRHLVGFLECFHLADVNVYSPRIAKSLLPSP
jgi:hypothetical protein